MTESRSNITDVHVLLDLYRGNIRYLLRYGLPAVLIVGLVSLFMPQKFVSDATIVPPDAGSSASSSLASLLSAAPVSLAASGAEAKTALHFVEILKSRTLRENVCDSLNLEELKIFDGMNRREIVNYLEKSTVIEIFKTGKVSIEVQIGTPWFPNSEDIETATLNSARIANAYTAELDRMNRVTATKRAKRTKAYLERVIKQTLDATSTLQDSLQSFQQNNKVLGLREQLDMLATSSGQLQAEVSRERLILSLMEQEFQPDAAPIQLQRQKVRTLENQYERVQQGGLVATDELSIPASKLPELSRTYLNLMRDLKTNEQVLAYLQSQRMQEVVQEERDVPTIVQLDVAQAPISRSSPARILMMAVATFVVLALYLFIVPVVQSIASRQGDAIAT
jgi:uncharacterized protein involved in exopolysaccharide biosynthesis